MSVIVQKGVEKCDGGEGGRPQSSASFGKGFLFLFFFLINVLTSSLTVLSKSLRISRMRSPSELEVVDSASGDRRAMIGDDKGVSKSSSDNGLVNGLVTIVDVVVAAFTDVVAITVASALGVVVGIIGALICEDALSSEASELVSDRVGLPPTFGR